MLFNSYQFIFIFFPVVLVVFFQLARLGHARAAGFLALASLFFYGYWSPVYVGLLAGSIACNYVFGSWIAKSAARGIFSRQRLLFLAVSANLLLLAYYKYANFFLSSVNSMAGSHLSLREIILPLGISFFTFTQITFLVDTYQGKVKEYSFIHYALFVTYFPHLIAGPILHHKEMMPQFAKATTYRFSYENMAVGCTIFFIGLFKKVVLADGVSAYVETVFGAPAQGLQLSFIEAWVGAISYALQLYFDFSGYSDMAIGLSRMFGVILPLNFSSPYKAVNIIEFWRCWHMTLSRFLRDYVYIPLGGNRMGASRRYTNLMVTMVLGGLWHGAGWTFVVWGALHGVYLAINHAWHALRRKVGQDPQRPLSTPAHICATFLTFVSVTVAWVFFRADSFDTALKIAAAMFGGNGLSLPDYVLPALGEVGRWLAGQGVPLGAGNQLGSGRQIIWIVILLSIVCAAPNTQQLLRGYRPALDAAEGVRVPGLLIWKPQLGWLLLISVMALLSLAWMPGAGGESPFLYFQF